MDVAFKERRIYREIGRIQGTHVPRSDFTSQAESINSLNALSIRAGLEVSFYSIQKSTALGSPKTIQGTHVTRSDHLANFRARIKE